MWDLPMFDIDDSSAAMMGVRNCREAYPNHSITITAYDPRHCRQTSAFDVIVNRPEDEPGWQIERIEVHDRKMNSTLRPYANEQPKGRRYVNGQSNGNGNGRG